MPYSDCVSPKSRWTLCPAACAATRATESAAGGAELTSVFHGLLGGRTGQPPTIGPLVTTKGALVEHERPRQPDRLLGALDLRDVAAALEDDLLGVGEPLRDVALEAGRDEPVAGAPHEERGRLELGQPGIEAAAAEGAFEVDVARRGEEGQ